MRPGIYGFRWGVVAFLFSATLINFINRLSVAVLGPIITDQLHLSNAQFANLTTCFLIAYTASQGLSGKMFDKVGTRIGFIVSISVWSLSSMAHALASGVILLSCLRFVLGLGEGGAWPGAAKAIAEWFPAKERALAMGICNSGSAVGTAVATPIILWIELRWGWRTTFLVIGLLGLPWLLLWAWLYRNPPRDAESPALPGAASHAVPSGQKPRDVRWLDLLRHPETWAIVVSRFFGDPVWWLYITWLPLYLYRVRHFSLKEIGLFAWMPFLAADAGSLMGGWLSGRLIAKGWSVNKARKTVILLGMLLMCCGIPAAFAGSAMAALGFIGAVLFGFQFWISNVQTLSSDYFPESAVGSVMGLGGVGAGIGAMLITIATGWTVDRYSYTPVLLAAGLLPLVATAALFALGRTIQPIALDQSPKEA